MDDTQEFGIGTILTVIRGVFVDPVGINEVGRFLAWITDDHEIMTHQLARVAEECQPAVAKAFPDLASVRIPPVNSQDDLMAFLSSLTDEYGTTRRVGKLPGIQHAIRNPVEELIEMRGGSTEGIIVVIMQEGDEH